ncbi:zf-DHHC-domain-containing protein [Trametes coccinea BRFM310]|uniref:Palmitoyltransferase n=1 Tax=Trametes coccinea (strain BRFM310) TaxID=1353009 RepID=A0A1Y2IG00_TRAC3|nr:zf-DHHC-domain-containing protein [Trametes coccinea BRFM310]
MAPNGTATKGPDASEEHKCVGMVQEARERSAKRRAKPQPWIVRKFTILIALAIIVYAFYVYIGRLCVPMIRRDPGALGGRGLGIAFLAVFCLIGLTMLWAYEKVILTSPGYAKHHVKKSPPPVIKNGLPTWWDTESEADLAAAQYQASQSPPQPEPKAESRHSTSRSRSQVNGDARRHGSTNTRRKPSQNSHAEPEDPNAGITDAIPPVAAARAKATAGKGTLARPERAHTSPSSTHHPQSDENIQPLPGTANAPEAEAKPMMFTRKPPTTPILQPEYRYCHTDGFLKPMRAHHCRACGTCVLKYDHHCPWIGQCVGARNHRFFLIFLFWGFLFSVWTFATSVGLNARAASQRTFFNVDGQQVAIMSLSGLFVLFTGVLVFTHVDMILSNQSTVESLGVRRMREREKRVIQRLHSWGDFRGKRETRKQWDQEWGRIGKEGHPWWLGSARANWEATMGERVWMWFLPIGKSPDDGLSYELNPRFDSEGRWRPRREWPRELQ